MAQTLGTLLIDVKSDTTQLIQGFNRAESAVNKTTKNMGTAIKTLAAAYVSLEAVDLAKSYARQVDELTNVNNRLKLATKTSEEFASAQKELFNQAQDARSIYTGTIDLYGRIAKSTENLALSQKELLNVTGSINKAMIIGGGSAESQQAALIQLGQAFSSNFKAVGQELGSIREQAPRLYEAMIKGTLETNKQFKALVDNGAEASGVFKKWAEEGKLSSEIVINALKSQGVVLNSEFSQMSMTIEQSMVTARNSLQKLIYDFDQTSGISATVSKSINDISKSMDSLDAETIVKIAEGFKDGAIAVATMYASIKATSAGFAAYGAITQKITEWNKASVEYELAKTKAINLGEQAVKARKLADEALNASRQSGLVIAEKQYLLLEKEATKLEAAAKKQQALSYSLESTARGFNVAAIASNAFKTALASIPFMAVSIAISAVATALLSASRNAEILSDTLNAPIEKLQKLTENQLKNRTRVLSEEIDNQIKVVKKRLDDVNQDLSTAASWVDTKKIQEQNLSAYDDEVQKLNEIIQKRDEILSLTNKQSTAQKETITPTKFDTTSIDDMVKKTLNPYQSALDDINKKWKEQFDILTENGKDTSGVVQAWTAEIKKLDEDTAKANNKLDKENQKSLENRQNQYANYYEKVKDFSKLWQLEEQRIREENYLLKQDEINKLIELERAAFEAKANATGIESAQTDISYQERKLQLQADSYEKEVALAELQYANNILNVESLAKTREEKDYLLSLEYELYNATLERLRAEDNIKNIDSTLESQTSLLDTQLELLDATDAWGNSFGGIAGNIANISSAMGKLGKIEIANKKQQLKLDSDLAKTKEKYGKHSIEYVEMENKAIMSKSQLAESSQKAELDGWGNIAGAMSGAFKEGSDAALAFRAIQIGIATVSAGQALITAWADPTIPAIVKAGYVATVAANVAQLLSMIGGGSGGGGGSYSQAEIGKFNIEAEYTPMIGRLDRQIELLEKIERNGSAGAIKVDLAAITFEKDYKLLVNEFLPKLHNSLAPDWGKGAGARALNEKQFEDMLGFNLGHASGGEFYIDKKALKEGFNLMRLIETINANWDYFHSAGFGPLLDKNWGQAGDPMSMTIARIGQITNDMQELLHEYTMSLLDSMQDLKDAKEEYISIYEELTDSRIFTDKKLADAFKSFNSLLATGETYSHYIYKEINNLQNLEKFLTNDKIEILLSQDAANLKAQLDLLDELKRETGLTFQNGARDAIDFLESIKLVSEALVTSRNNIKSFIDSFKSDDLLAKDLSITFGEDLAKNWDELKDKLAKMSSDEFGLTDEDLEFLETNKAYIERLQELEEEGRVQALESQKNLNEELKKEAEKTLSEIKNNISKITSTLNTLGNTIDRLRGNADTTNTYTLNKFYESMAKTQELLKGKDYEAISNSIKETVGYSSALSDSKNFTLTRDMQYAQLVAAKQFEDMDITLNEELDYLKMIEENTAKTVEALTAKLGAIGNQISNSINSNSDKFDEYAKELEKLTGTSAASKLVKDIYTKYQLHQYQTDDSGYKHWEEQVSSGAISPSQLDSIIKTVADDIIMAQIKAIYSKYDLHKYQTDDSGYKYWQDQIYQGKVSSKDLDESIKQSALKALGINSFAVGTPNVPRDMLAQIHQGEIITPKTYSEGIRNGDLMMGNVSSIESALDGISNSVNALVGIASSQLMQLRDIRDISNGSLVSLQNMEAII